MSVKVNHLTKKYGTQKAVDDISFEVRKGEIVGFLGPNGAGKSTTMKIITGFLQATEGTVHVCDLEVHSKPIAVKEKIGYLPEHNPLYVELYIKEYLEHVAGYYKLKKPQQRISEMIALTGLEREQNKKIGQLSKGYRQRVGLAQAMIHEPEVLILDEPTSGLDPNQLVEIRNLIKTIGKSKTVILSTHIMQEVEQLCNRVIIINQGKLVADEQTEKLQQSMLGKQVLRVTFNINPNKNDLLRIPGISKAKPDVEANTWLLEPENGIDIRKAVFDFAVNKQIAIFSQQLLENSLEEVFRALTQNKPKA